MPGKELIVVGGPNGAGKTTVVRELLTEYAGFPYLGADQIAAELAPHDVASVQVEAGREFLRRIDRSLDDGQRFIVESTLSGRGFRRTLERGSALGYEVTVIFVMVDSAETCVARVRERVHKGGHNVPEIDIRRRFTRSLKNFWTLYRPIADKWFLWYNSGSNQQEVAVGTVDSISVSNDALFEQYRQLAEIVDD